MTFKITENTYPANDPLTTDQYENGLRDPYWVAQLALSSGQMMVPYIPEVICREHEFYKWCVERNIHIEMVNGGRSTILIAYIQNKNDALEAKMWFG